LAPMYSYMYIQRSETHYSFVFFFRRGLTPPHSVKSISMASFSPEEVELIKSRGNDVSDSFYHFIRICRVNMLNANALVRS